MATIDYRLAKLAVLRDLHRGMVSRFDVCDAHPELMRAARYLGEEIRDACPICGESGLRLVLFTYGKDLKRSNGYARRREEIGELRSRVGEFVCYIVEVCTECSWNHLVQSFVAGQRHAG